MVEKWNLWKTVDLIGSQREGTPNPISVRVLGTVVGREGGQWQKAWLGLWQKNTFFLVIVCVLEDDSL